MPDSIGSDPFNQAKPHQPTLADVEGSSYCLNAVVTRLRFEKAVVLPVDTFLSGEIWSWHRPMAMQGKGSAITPVRVGVFCDGHAKVVTEGAVQDQCSPPSAPGIGPVPWRPRR